MKLNYLVLLIVVLLSINLVGAVEVGYDNPDLYGIRAEEPATNYSTVYVNSSDYWDNLNTPADITYDGLSAGDVNALGYTGTFNYLAGVLGQLSMDGNPWYLGGTSFQIAEDLIVDGDSNLNNTYPQNTLSSSLGSGALRWLKLWVADINAENIEAFNLNLTDNLVVGGNLTTIGAMDITGDITANDLVLNGTLTHLGADANWGYFNNGTCIVIGNLSYISEC